MHTLCRQKDPKFIYYLSAEFLMGRSLLNTVLNLGLEDEYGDAVKQLGYSLEELVDAEQNAALGNGGLGRLAACFLDSIATLDLPGWGYGIRYKYGMFRQVGTAHCLLVHSVCAPGLCWHALLQTLDKGFQKEIPDIWLQNGNPWEIARPNISYKVGFYGTVDNFKWSPAEEVYLNSCVQSCLAPVLCCFKVAMYISTDVLWLQVIAACYDNPIPGYGTNTVGNLRLWEAKPVTEFDLEEFNEGHYVEVKHVVSEYNCFLQSATAAICVSCLCRPISCRICTDTVAAASLACRLWTRSVRLRTSAQSCTRMTPQSMARSCV